MALTQIAHLNLEECGIKEWGELYYNLSFDELFKHETNHALVGYERAQVTELGAVNVDTGKFTGRSPKDKYIVEEESSKNTVWWADGTSAGSDNKKISVETWKHLKELSVKQLNGKKLYVMDGLCGTDR